MLNSNVFHGTWHNTSRCNREHLLPFHVDENSKADDNLFAINFDNLVPNFVNPINHKLHQILQKFQQLEVIPINASDSLTTLNFPSESKLREQTIFFTANGTQATSLKECFSCSPGDMGDIVSSAGVSVNVDN